MQRDKGNNFLRVFAIVEHLVDAGAPRSLAEITKATGLPKPSASRLCRMLEEEGFLSRHLDGQRYGIGARFFAVARGVIAGGPWQGGRRAVLERLVADVGETCNISIPDRTAMLYADRVEASLPLRIQLPIASRVPLHCTASGKLYLSTLATRRRRALIGRLELKRHTAKTLVDPGALEAELERVRAAGHGSDDEEFLEGMVAVSVPIRDGAGRFCASLAVHGPIQRMTLDRAKSYLPRLRSAADELEDLLANSG
jgi:DNA-binding IclR family transcriptional regulator